LENILGGGQEAEDDYRDFVNRYEQGSPHEGYSDEEVSSRYQQVSRQMPSDLIKSLHKKPLAACQERMQFGQHLRQQTRQQNYNFLTQTKVRMIVSRSQLSCSGNWSYPPAAARYAWSVNGRCRRMGGGGGNA